MNNKNLKLIIKRILAYMIDILIVTIITSLITTIPIFNKEYKKYENLYNEFHTKYTEYTNIIVKINDSYKDKKIEQEEYDKIIESPTYKNIIQSNYDDQIIDEKEYNDLKKKIDEKYISIADDYNYKLQKLGIYNSVITLVCTLFYFGILQYFLKGQTIGKKIMSIKVRSITPKKLKMLTLIARSLIVNNIFLNTVNIIFLSYTSKVFFNKADNIISLLISLVEAMTIFLIITREDNRGLHDLLLKTTVVSTKE